MGDDGVDWLASEERALSLEYSEGRLTREEYLQQLRSLRQDAARESDEQDMRDAGRM